MVSTEEAFGYDDAEGLKEGNGCMPMEASTWRIAAAIRSVNEERRIRESVPDRYEAIGDTKQSVSMGSIRVNEEEEDRSGCNEDRVMQEEQPGCNERWWNNLLVEDSTGFGWLHSNR